MYPLSDEPGNCTVLDLPKEIGELEQFFNKAAWEFMEVSMRRIAVYDTASEIGKEQIAKKTTFFIAGEALFRARQAEEKKRKGEERAERNRETARKFYRAKRTRDSAQSA